MVGYIESIVYICELRAHDFKNDVRAFVYILNKTVNSIYTLLVDY